VQCEATGTLERSSNVVESESGVAACRGADIQGPKDYLQNVPKVTLDDSRPRRKNMNLPSVYQSSISHSSALLSEPL
jgi:hypothetical protein